MVSYKIVKLSINTHKKLTELKKLHGLVSYDEIIKRLTNGELQPKNKQNKSEN